MGQPEDSPGVQLVDPLAADAHCVANSGRLASRSIIRAWVDSRPYARLLIPLSPAARPQDSVPRVGMLGSW